MLFKFPVFTAERQAAFRPPTPSPEAFFDTREGAVSEFTARALKIRESARIFEQHIRDLFDRGTWPLRATHNGILFYWMQLGDEGAAASIASEISTRLKIAPPLEGSTYVPYVVWHRVEAAEVLLSHYEDILLGMGAHKDDLLYPILESTASKRKLVTQYLGVENKPGDDIPSRDQINQYISEGNIARFVVHYADLMLNKCIEDDTDDYYSLAALDEAPSSIIARLNGISPARMSQLISQKKVDSLRAPGSREVFVSFRQVQQYLSRVRRGGARVNPPQTIRAADGLLYHSVKAVSEMEEFDLTAAWIAQLVRDKKVKGFRSQLAGKRVYVNLDSLRNYLSVKAER